MSQEQKDKKTKNKKRNLIIRISISIFLLIFFASKVDLNETLNLITHTNYVLLLICVIIYLAGQAISAFKWSIIGEAIGFQRKFADYLQFYFIGMFFNLFLPSTIGGDVSKAYYLSKGDTNGRKAPAIYAVLAERYSGLAVLVWLGTLAMLTPIGHNIPMTIKYVAIALSTAIIIGSPLLPFFIKKVFSQNNWLNRSMMNDILVFWDYKLVAKCLGWSLIFHILVIIIHMLISKAINLHIPLLYYCSVYPIVAIIGFIPIAFNGIGVREGSYIYLLSLAGVSKSAGLAFGLLWFVIVVITSLIGGIVYIKGHHAPPPEEYEPPGFNLDDITSTEYDQSYNQTELNESSNLLSNRN